MRCPLDADSSHSPAWKRLLIAGTLLASCTCSASPELPSSASLDFLMEGAIAHLPVPSGLDGVLSTSWFQGHEARSEAMIFSPEGLPGPGHTGRETLDTQGNLVIRNVTAQDSGSYTVVLETRKEHRSKTEQIHVKATRDLVLLLTFPENFQGVIQSDLNYSVVLKCLTAVSPDPVLHWTLNGELCGTGGHMIIRRLSWEDLGTYVCVAKNSQEQHSSKSVTISLPQVNVDPTDTEPIEPDPILSVSGGAAIALILAGNVGGVILVGGLGYAIIQSQRLALNGSPFMGRKTPSHSFQVHNIAVQGNSPT